MYAVIGICIADEVFTNKLKSSEPLGAMIIVSIHPNIEDAQESLKNQHSLSSKSPIPLIYDIVRIGTLKVLTMNEESYISPSECPIPDSPISPEPSVIEELANSFSTLIHSMGVRDHSQKLMEQALDSILRRKDEVETNIKRDPSLYEKLINYYESNLPPNSPILNRIMRFLTDTDSDGLPKCLHQ